MPHKRLQHTDFRRWSDPQLRNLAPGEASNERRVNGIGDITQASEDRSAGIVAAHHGAARSAIEEGQARIAAVGWQAVALRADFDIVQGSLAVECSGRKEQLVAVPVQGFVVRIVACIQRTDRARVGASSNPSTSGRHRTRR